MSIHIDYNDCLSFIKHRLNVDLLPYQETMLKALCDGYEVRTCRGSGRTFVASCIGKYVADKLGSNNYAAMPDVTFTYTCAKQHGLLTPDKLSLARKTCGDERFAQEYLCEFHPTFDDEDD